MQDDVLLGREVAKERTGRDFGGRGDLLDRGRLVALLGKETHGVFLNGGVGLGLLAFA